MKTEQSRKSAIRYQVDELDRVLRNALDDLAKIRKELVRQEIDQETWPALSARLDRQRAAQAEVFRPRRGSDR